MKLSIITVNLNNRDGLQRTIDSVVGQTFRDFEWIVIDGGSTDGSRELIEQYADHFAYWVSEPDKGIYNAMNKGIKVAKGEYLQFLNSGDWLWEKETLEQTFSACNNELLLFGNAEFTSNSEIHLLEFPDLITPAFFLNDNLCHQSVFAHKSLFEKHLFNESLKVCSDFDFLFKNLIIDAISYKHLNVTICCYDITGISSDSELVNKERNKILQELTPQTITDDLIKLFHLNNTPYLLLKKDIDNIWQHKLLFRIYKKVTHILAKLC